MTQYTRIKAPPEFREWLEERQKNMENLAKEMGNKKPIPLTQVMRVISKTEGVDLNDFLIKQLRKKIR